MSQVSITDREGFAAQLNSLRDAAAAIKALRGGEDVMVEITAAASARQGLIRFGPAAEGSTPAPVYAGTAAAMGELVGAVDSQVNAASTSLESVVADMERLLKSINSVDQGAATRIGAL